MGHIPQFPRDRSHSFTDRLYEALIKAHIRVWIGDVERKESVEAMEDSVAFVVVLSPEYARSHWCRGGLTLGNSVSDATG